MTYDVYFTDDPDLPGHKIKHKHIKLPMQTARQKLFPTWYKYQNKVFYDAGTKKGEDPEDPEYCLEKGEWMVGEVTDNNNFICLRLGQPHVPENNEVFDIGYCMRQIRKYEEE